jgi:cell division septal protein FtsQ
MGDPGKVFHMGVETGLDFHNPRHAVQERGSSNLVVVLLGVGFLALVAAQWQGRQRVEQIAVNGASALSLASVRSTVDSLLYRRHGAISLADVRELVERHPYVARATVYRSGIRGIAVDVEERAPVAHLVQADGTLRYVDARGEILPETNVIGVGSIPLLQGPGRALTPDEVRAAVKILMACQRTVDPLLYHAVSEVRLDPNRNAVKIMTDRSSWRLSANDAAPEQAFARLDAYWKHNASGRTPLDIDLRWSDQVVVRYASTITTEHAQS